MQSHTNRLARQSSPYLLQHAHNPVDWYPWGEEAFAAARRQDKPIFLSVGYSTCYWCHVMERECFENEAIARQMNEDFISIKVDREERPDVDQLYMTFVQVHSRQGGWPLSAFLMPDLRPFYGGTYFPPVGAHGRPGFPQLLRGLDDAWRNRRSDIEQLATQFTEILAQLAEPARPEEDIVIDRAFIARQIERSTGDFDPVHGGFGDSPKFPRQTLIELLLTCGNDEQKRMAYRTLDAIFAGGIRDHLGGGFHRYSTDERWVVPHFEIMLYDNALLAWCYAEAYRQTREARYEIAARGAIDFTLREMTSPDGAFYTAFDAEVDAREGGSYLWTREEVEAALSSFPHDAVDAFLKAYGLDGPPNFADPHHGTGRPDRYVLCLGDSSADIALLAPMRDALLAVRDHRKQPMLDTKIITSWNALMVRAMAHAGTVFDDARYTAAAHRCADSLLASRRRTFLDDYAFLAHGLLALGRRDDADAITAEMLNRFADPRGGFYFTEASVDALIVRQKIATDSPLPSGNAVAAQVLLELGQHERAAGVIETFALMLRNNPEGASSLVQAAARYVERHGELVALGGGEKDPANDVVSLAAQWVSPNELRVRVQVQDGYHLNGHPPAKGLVSTSLHVSGAELDSIEYPNAERYAGDFEIRLRTKAAVKTPVALTLTFQACTEDACLHPGRARLEVSAP